MTYVRFVNHMICEALGRAGRFVAFGQNISAGSCLAGLTRGLPSRDGLRVINTPNCENAQVGLGFGMMLRGVDCAFFVKQLDFLLLTCDQMVNTYNMIRQKTEAASFTIVAIVVDSGYEGPQSRLNNLADFCSMGDLRAFAVTNKLDAEAVFGCEFQSPGFRIIAVSQRLFGEALLSPGGDSQAFGGCDIIRYAEGQDVTIVAHNFAFPRTAALSQLCRERWQLNPSLFSVPAAHRVDWRPILDDLKRSRRLVILDDGRGLNRQSHQLRLEAQEIVPAERILAFERPVSTDLIRPNADLFEVDEGRLQQFLEANGAKSLVR